MKTNTETEQKEQQIEQETKSFYSGLLPYGSRDIYTAVEFAIDAGLSGDELAELVNDFSTDTETKLGDVDVCYVVYDHVLQMARNTISRVIGYDFCNDFHGDTEIYTYGNCMCTQYDFSESAKNELVKKITGATEDQKDELREDIFVTCFLKELDIDVLKV